MQTRLKHLGFALALALPVALPSALCSAPAHAQAASQQAVQANYYQNQVDFDFVKQWAGIPPKKGVLLIDARPTSRKFNLGHIPGAINIPDSHFEQMKDQLPLDKSTLLIYYCEGPACVLSHNSAKKAEALGHTNIKVYTNGYPEWVAKGETAAVAGAYVKKLIDQKANYLLVDSRPARVVKKDGMIPTAINISDSQFDQHVAQLPADKATELVFYCGGLQCPLSGNSAEKARKLGYTDVKTYALGHPDWVKLYGATQAAAAPAATAAGAAATASVAVETGKEKGSVSAAWFERIIKENPGALLVIDVRDAKEYSAGSIKGAINIPIADLAQKIGALPTDKPIVFVCATGARSGEAYDTVKEIRAELNAYFLDAKVSYAGDGSFRILL